MIKHAGKTANETKKKEGKQGGREGNKEERRRDRRIEEIGTDKVSEGRGQEKTSKILKNKLKIYTHKSETSE
jgi:hypothetical protein